MEDIIFREFPAMDERMKERISLLYPAYAEWNEKINVISRKDIDMLYLHHVLHSLAIAKYKCFEKGSRILDVGTGGGFPGIPLAIMYPECRFTLCDSIGKKIRVVNAVVERLGLENVTALNGRAENAEGMFDYVVSRAVTDLRNFIPWVKGKYSKSIIYLKGGDVTGELKTALKTNRIAPEKATVTEISDFFKDAFFNEKKIIEIRK